MTVPALVSWISRLYTLDLLFGTALQLEIATTNMITRQNATIPKVVVILAIPPFFFFVYETTPHTLIQRLGATNYYETGQVIGDTLG